MYGNILVFLIADDTERKRLLVREVPSAWNLSYARWQCTSTYISFHVIKIPLQKKKITVKISKIILGTWSLIPQRVPYSDLSVILYSKHHSCYEFCTIKQRISTTGSTTPILL